MMHEVFLYQGIDDFELGASKLPAEAMQGTAANQHALKRAMMGLVGEYALFLSQLKYAALADHLANPGFVEQSQFTEQLAHVLLVHADECTTNEKW